MKSFEKFLFLFGLFYLILTISTIASVNLTEEETEFINFHDEIKIGVDPEFHPYEFIDSDGLYKGISADYVALINEKTGLNLQPVYGLTWGQAYDNAVEGEISVLPCVGITEERKKYFLYTEPYMSFQRVILSNSDISEKNYKLNDLNDLKVGVQRNSSHHSFLINETEITPILFQTAEEGLIALSNGKIDAFVANLASAGYLIKEIGLTNIKVDDTITKNTGELAFAVNKNQPILAEIIEKGLKEITQEERIEIRNKWIGIEKEVDYSEIIRATLIIGGILSAIIIYTSFWAYRLKKEIKRRLKVEEELVKAKKASDEANAAKSIFLARMSHEIRTPLNAITGMAYLMKKTSLSEVQSKYVKRLTDASHNLSEVINDILDFSKIESGELKLEHIPFNLDRILDKVSNILNSKALGKGLDFIIHKETRIPNEFIGDPIRISQVLINLINNAIKFTSKGEIFVNLELISEDEEFMKIKFSVKDTGIGIPKRKIKNLFNPFDQLDSSTTRKYGGTGLGLAISRNIVNMIGGDIKVESIEGTGSMFSFIIPLQKNKTLIDENKKKKTFPSLGHIKTMIVDENKISEQILKEYLESFVISAESVNNGMEILSILKKENFDLLIISHSLMDMDGFELCEHITQMKLKNKPKIIFITNSVREDIFNSAKSVGIDFIMLKPVIPSVLYDAIIQLFSDDGTVVSEELESDDRKRGEGFKVLLVEDYEINQLISKEILEHSGFEVFVSDNGKEALEFMNDKGENIDAVLMDIHMPIMNGYEATREIRKTFNETPIIAMTAVAISGVQKECLDAGMDDYITKPIDPEKMFASLEKHISEFRKIKPVNHGKNITKLPDDEPEEAVEKLIDTRQGILRAANNEKLYFEVLEKFYNDNLDTCQNADNMIKTNRKEELKKLVHKIKGASGNLGGNKLYISSKTLLEALNSRIDKNIIPYFKEFENDMDNTLNEIIKIVDNRKKSLVDKKEKIEANDECTELDHSKLNELRILLEANDIDAFKIVESILQKNNNSITCNTFLAIKKEMDGYRFTKALEILDEYMAENTG